MTNLVNYNNKTSWKMREWIGVDLHKGSTNSAIEKVDEEGNQRECLRITEFGNQFIDLCG